MGPTTPFGALEKVHDSQSRDIAEVKSSGPVKFKIKFFPEKQVLHDKTDFSVEIKSNRPFSDKTKIQISYNGVDVTEPFLQNSYLHTGDDGRTRIYMFKDMRLKTLNTNHIQVRVLNDKGQGLYTRFYEEPSCSLFAEEHLAHLGNFHAPEEFIGLIEKVAKEKQTNPAFLAGVVAQESGFNPKAVSWAKAIGLTQITPLAESQVLESVDDWPRYPGINTLSYITLKSKIFLGEINDEKEWRLNPEKSLKGGLTYFQYLKKYWSLEDNKKLIEELGGDKDQLLTDLILASYNSGAARVKSAVVTYKHKWRQHQGLQEAIRYLKKVNSYCYHYTKKEVDDDNET